MIELIQKTADRYESEDGNLILTREVNEHGALKRVLRKEGEIIDHGSFRNDIAEMNNIYLVGFIKD